MAKSEVVHIRIDPEVKEKALNEAKREGRTLSDWAARLIAAAVGGVKRRKETRQ